MRKRSWTRIIYVLPRVSVSFALAHFIWPVEINRKDEGFDMLGMIEIIIEIPCRLYLMSGFKIEKELSYTYQLIAKILS